MYHLCGKVFVLSAVSSCVMSGSVSMYEVKFLLRKIVCFRIFIGFVCSVSEHNGCCEFCVSCLNFDASNFRWVRTRSILVSSCKC